MPSVPVPAAAATPETIGGAPSSIRATLAAWPMAVLCALVAGFLAWALAGGPRQDMAAAPADSDAGALQKHATRLAERLRLADAALRAAASDLKPSATSPASVGAALPAYFDAVVRQGADGVLTPLRGTGATSAVPANLAPGALADGETLLTTVPGANGTRDMFLTRRIAAAGSAGDLLTARLTGDYLWGTDGGPPQVTCVVTGDNTLLHCPAGRLRDFLDTSARPLDTQAGQGGTMELHAVRVALPVAAAHRSWTLLALRDDGAATQPSRHAATGIALLAALAAFALALLAGRRRLGRDRARTGVSDVRAPGQSADVARGQRTLAALADIDQAILSGADEARLLAVGVAHLRACCAAPAALAVIDDPRSEQYTLALATRDRTREPIAVKGVALLPRVGVLLEANPQGIWCDRLDDLPFLAPLAEAGQHHAFVIPLFEDGRLAGAAALGSPDRDAGDESCLAHARWLATRLGVALTAALRARALYLQTHYDAATRLPNRRYLREHLGPQIARTRRDDKRLALLFVDLDGFKRVNATAGHDHGDAILAEAAVRMRDCVREEDILARFGGDEFVMVLPRIADALDARKVADKLLATLSRSYALSGEEFRLGASIGISVFPDDAQSVDELLRHADFAMFRAKAAGRGQYAFYNDEVNRKADERNRLEAELRRACEAGEFTVHFQPQFSLADGHLDGAEALVRWLHPQRGLVPPGAFMPVAEQSSLIIDIGDIVLRAALRQYSTWEALGIAPPRVSVNVTALELQRADFAERIEGLLDSACLRPYCLELEITEGSLLNGSDDLLEQLERLRRRGVRIALDDFGTGYSSLSYLKRLPVDVVKIDRSFVRDIDHDNDAAAIARAIVDMAHSLGKSVIAEGVETDAQRERLRLLGCESAQGFLWSPALPASDLGQRFLARGAAVEVQV